MVETPAERGLGWLPAPDPRDALHTIRSVMPNLTTPKIIRISTRLAFFSSPLDQGQEGTCVGHGFKHWMMTAPVVSKAAQRPTAVELYLGALPRDEWSENDNPPDMQFGTSLNACAKYCRALGALDSWKHSENPDEVIDFLAGVDQETGQRVGGGVILGLPWKDTMWDTDEKGFLDVGGQEIGGHCVFGNWWNQRAEFMGGPNSWGRSFGPLDRRGRRTGFWKLTKAALFRLFDEGAHAVMALEKRIPRIV